MRGEIDDVREGNGLCILGAYVVKDRRRASWDDGETRKNITVQDLNEICDG